MGPTSSERHEVLGVSDDVIGDLLADCYVFLLRQRYERLAATKKDGGQVEENAKEAVMGIPTVPTPSNN
jgi:hypothetical protein